ncbi:MAG: hypothetical protein U1E83_03640 [Methylotetracoccus sp.]
MLRALTCIASAVALDTSTAIVNAAPSCQLDPERPKLMRLELTVPATYCARVQDDPSCLEFPKPSAIQLHGLWPNYQSGHPSGQCDRSECREQTARQGRYCAFPEPDGLYQAAWWPRLKPYMAGAESCLERHEWVKHGTCSGMKAANYFAWSLESTRRIAEALAEASDRMLTRDAFDRLVRDRLPDLDGAIRLNCRRNTVSSLYVLYEWGDPPGQPMRTRDSANHFGNCPKSFVIPSRPRS